MWFVQSDTQRAVLSVVVATAIYCRISSDPRGTELGVDRQEQDCRKLAESLGWNDVRVFADNDTSAFSGKRRPQYEAMLDAIEGGEIQALVAWHSDRLHRSPIELERFIELVDKQRVEIRTVTSGTLDLSTSAGRMVARILGSVARQESEHSSERRKRANDQRAAAGEWVATKTPFGFTSDGLHVESEAQAIRSATAEILAGGTLRGVARQWNAAGHRTRTTGQEWGGTTVRRVLLNPRHAGMVVHRGDVVGRGQWEPIVDRDDQLAVEAILSDPARRNNVSFERKYQGTQVYRCGVCGKRVQVHRAGERVSYACLDRHVRRNQGALDEYISAIVVGHLSSQRVEVVSRPDTSAMSTRRDGLRVRLDELAALFASGVIDASQLARGTGDLRAELEKVERQIAEARQVNPLDGESDLGAAWERLSPDARGKVIDAIVTVTIMPAPRGQKRFLPEYVDVEWKS
ncbi:recombinase family protein [Gordonia sputi]